MSEIIENKDLLNLITLGEGQKLEFKKSFSSNDIKKNRTWFGGLKV